MTEIDSLKNGDTIKTKVLFVASECVPFAKSGGLADVTGSLPNSLASLGYDVRVMMPFHRISKNEYADKTKHLTNFNINLGWRTKYVGVEELSINNVIYYFVDNESYFGDCMYRGGDSEGEQYAFFTKAVIESLSKIDFIPDVLIANDWHTAMLPMLIKTQYEEVFKGKIKTILLIHNLMYQGRFSLDMVADWLSIEPRYLTADFLEYYGGANFLKAGLIFADRLLTVSPTYASEIMYDYYAEGMSDILNLRHNDLYGILNGIDTDKFNPEKDKNIIAEYSKEDISGKYINKSALIEELYLNIDKDAKIISMVSRITEQKGIDLILDVINEIMQENIALVILGSGEKRYEDALKEAAANHNGRMCFICEYNDILAHRIYAGSDLLLMPSRFEPCGISQMIALRYGTLPIVRETGGLKDTVKPYNEYTGDGNGFSFTNYNAYDMLNTIRFALKVLKDKPVHMSLINKAMSEDNSFLASAKKYAQIIDNLLSRSEVISCE
ncbi:MAG: glycogen/starch synthase [Eubacteriales bacterium]